jgi:hypothetical protein
LPVRADVFTCQHHFIASNPMLVRLVPVVRRAGIDMQRQ